MPLLAWKPENPAADSLSAWFRQAKAEIRETLGEPVFGLPPAGPVASVAPEPWEPRTVVVTVQGAYEIRESLKAAGYRYDGNGGWARGFSTVPEAIEAARAIADTVVAG